MSDNWVQFAVGNGTTTAAATLSGVVPGNALLAFFGNGSNFNPVALGVADAQGSYLACGARAADSANNVVGQWFRLLNANTGSHTATGTTDSGNGCDIILVEVGTTAGASAFSDANQAHQSSPTTGTDALSSGTVAVTAAATLVGLCIDSSSTSVAQEPATGTGFTNRSGALSTNLGVYRLESIAAAADRAVTATAIVGTHEFLTFGVAILNASAGGSSVPIDDDVWQPQEPQTNPLVVSAW